MRCEFLEILPAPFPTHHAPLPPPPPPHTRTNTYTLMRAHSNTPLDHWTPIARGDDSDATAEAIATCAGIAPFNSLQGWRIDRHYSAWSTPHSYEVVFSGQWIPIFWSFYFYFFPAHTSHHIIRHALAVGNHPGEWKKSQEESEKEKKDVCDHNRRESNPQPIDWKSLHIPLHHMGHTHTHTPARTHTQTHTHTHTHTYINYHK